MMFKRTAKQKEQTKLFASSAKHICSFGGSRSGKTFGTVRAIILRMRKCPGSKHLIVRKYFSSVKRSVFMGTMLKVLAICFPTIVTKINKTDYIYTIFGSELWFCGLDNAVAAEKILGNEFSTIFFNEISELDYSSVITVVSRLAEKNSLVKKVYYDMNPPEKSHWSYWLFIKKINPLDDEPLKDPEKYAYILMNPEDNLDNIDPEYIALLESMPEEQRNRFLHGLFADSSDGQAYYAFNREKHVESFKPFPNIPFMIGMDFNVDPMAAIIFQVVNNRMYVYDEVYLRNSDTIKMTNALHSKGYKGGLIYPDSTGKNRKTSGKSDFQILRDGGFTIKSVNNPLQRDRINNVNLLFDQDKIIINTKCKKLIADLEKVMWKNNNLDEGKDKMLTHISDCLGYPTWQIFPMNKVLKKTYSTAR